MKTLQDKVVVITGAGSGIGRALALNAAKRGAKLAISDVNVEGLAETVAQAEALGAPVHSATLDVADRVAFGNYAGDVAEHYGTVNVVINNAGVTMTGNFADLSYEEWDWIVGINLSGVMTGTKELLPYLIDSGDGHVVNISSLFGLLSMPGQSAYNATKYAVRGFSEALREEMLIDGHKVGVTVVHPGGIKTGISANGRKTKNIDAEALDKLFADKLARMSPDKAANIILKGVLHNQARVLVGADAHLLHWTAKLLGSRYQDVFARAARSILPPPAE